MALTLTEGDTAPTLTGTVSADLTGAAAVVHIRRPDGTVLTKPATITDAATGAWSIEWETGELSLTGGHVVEVQVTYANTRIQTFAVDAGGRTATFRVRGQLA